MLGPVIHEKCDIFQLPVDVQLSLFMFFFLIFPNVSRQPISFKCVTFGACFKFEELYLGFTARGWGV